MPRATAAALVIRAQSQGVDDSTGGGAGLTLSEDDGALRIRGDLTDAIENGEIHLYFVELPRYKASASLELTPGSSRNQMI